MGIPSTLQHFTANLKVTKGCNSLVSVEPSSEENRSQDDIVDNEKSSGHWHKGFCYILCQLLSQEMVIIGFLLRKKSSEYERLPKTQVFFVLLSELSEGFCSPVLPVYAKFQGRTGPDEP